MKTKLLLTLTVALLCSCKEQTESIISSNEHITHYITQDNYISDKKCKYVIYEKGVVMKRHYVDHYEDYSDGSISFIGAAGHVVKLNEGEFTISHNPRVQ